MTTANLHRHSNEDEEVELEQANHYLVVLVHLCCAMVSQEFRTFHPERELTLHRWIGTDDMKNGPATRDQLVSHHRTLSGVPKFMVQYPYEPHERKP